MREKRLNEPENPVAWRSRRAVFRVDIQGCVRSGNERVPGPHRDQSEGQGRIPRDRKARRTNNNEGGVKERRRPGLLCALVTAFLPTEFRTSRIYGSDRDLASPLSLLL